MATIESSNKANTFVFSMEADMEEALKVLEYFEDNEKKNMRAVLAGVGTTIANKQKKSYDNYLGRRTGELRKSIKRRVTRAGTGVVIEAKARAKDKVFYGYAHAEGSIITPKMKTMDDEHYLKFKIDGKWISSGATILEEKDFIREPALRYMRSSEYPEQIDRILQKQIAKAEKKYGSIDNAKNLKAWEN